MAARGVVERLQSPPVDPVVLTCSGFSFERKVLLDWLAIKMDCPITRRPCGKNAFVDNIALRKASEEWEKRRAKREAAKKAGDAANAILLKAAASFPKG
ncbi:hypothetical protein T484DRAFT_1806958 [Baffinella frigidus]|nr:hypothetical protein T484DRAFT_1806958 [Cryptophyta sp. CCMP2293]